MGEGSRVFLIIASDFQTRFRQVAMLNGRTSKMAEHHLEHETGEAKEFYASLSSPARVVSRALQPDRCVIKCEEDSGHYL
jgi:hypothetical protein